MPHFQYELNFRNELIVDNFAGGGGASIGIEMGTGRFVDIAINHDPVAMDVHKLNHPHAKHLKSDVFEVDPVKACNGRPVGFAWFSPDCTHHSKAKGSKPVKREIRGLAWVARKWAKAVRPRVIALENVEEFEDWGPVIPKLDKQGNIKRDQDGEIEMMPDPKRKGLTFNAFIEWFHRNGYKTEHRLIRAYTQGAPTIRRRLFMIARCDGLPIVWPESTHGHPKNPKVKKKKLKPYRTAAECIDWSIPCPSIFMTKEDAKEYYKATGTRIKRPIVDATCRRVAKGVMKFVVEDPNPFIVSYYGEKKEGEFRGHSLNEPLRTQTTENRHALCTPVIVPISHYNGRDTVHSINEPLRTITAYPKGGSFAVAMPFLARQFGNSTGNRADEPMGTVMPNGMGKTQLINVAAVPMIARQFNTGVCHRVDEPIGTIMANGGGGKNQLVSAFLAKHYTGVTGTRLDQPMGTVTAIDHHSLVQVTMAQEDIEAGAERVAAFLLKYYGTNTGHSLNEPMHTITAKDRLALVTVLIKGEPWVIVDIGIRMLQPHELMLAQGFPPDYKFGNISKTKKIALIGNSVSPPVAAAIAKANYVDAEYMRRTA